MFFSPAASSLTTRLAKKLRSCLLGKLALASTPLVLPTSSRAELTRGGTISNQHYAMEIIFHIFAVKTSLWIRVQRNQVMRKLTAGILGVLIFLYFWAPYGALYPTPPWPHFIQSHPSYLCLFQMIFAGCVCHEIEYISDDICITDISWYAGWRSAMSGWSSLAQEPRSSISSRSVSLPPPHGALKICGNYFWKYNDWIWNITFDWFFTAVSLSKRKSKTMTRMTPSNKDLHHHQQQQHKLDHHYQHSIQYIILLSFVRDRPAKKAGRKRPAAPTTRCFDIFFCQANISYNQPENHHCHHHHY